MRFLLYFLFFTLPIFAIVDIVPVDFQDTSEGFSGSAFGSYELKRGNTDKNELDIGGRLQFDTDETITWIEGEMEKDKVRGIDTDDNAFVHLRHVHQLYTPSWAWEVFTQFKKDQFKNIQDRSLVGGGLRYKVFDIGDYNKMFFGLGMYDERVSYTPDPVTGKVDPSEINLRMNSYLSYRTKVNKVLDVSLLSYFQPKVNAMHDYMAATTAELIVHLTKVLDLSYTIEYDYDSRPPTEIKKEDIDQRLSFIYRFGKDDPLSTYASSFLTSTDSLEDVNTTGIIAVEVETDVEDIEDFRDTIAGKWNFGKEAFFMDLDNKGTYRYGQGIYTQKFTWKVISTATQHGEEVAKDQGTKLVIISFEDKEGKLERVENYLWSDNTLVGLSGSTIRLFKR